MKTIILVGSLLGSQLAFAHGDHRPPPQVAKCAAKVCTKEEITQNADNALNELVKSDEKKWGAWMGAKFKTAEEKEFKKAKDWILTFTDETKPEGKQTLYVFVTLNGKLNGANFDGK